MHFRITFVSTSDPSQYVSAHLSMKAENMVPLQQAKEKFKPNLKFRLSKVGLEAIADSPASPPCTKIWTRQWLCSANLCHALALSIRRSPTGNMDWYKRHIASQSRKSATKRVGLCGTAGRWLLLRRP